MQILGAYHREFYTRAPKMRHYLGLRSSRGGEKVSNLIETNIFLIPAFTQYQFLFSLFFCFAALKGAF